MNTRRCHTDQHIALAHAIGAEQFISLHQTGCGTGNIVLMFSQKPRMLRRLAAHQRGTGNLASPGNTPHNIGNTLGNNLARSNIIGHEKGLRAAHHNIVHDHTHQVVANRVMNIERLRDSNLRAHTIRRSRQIGLAI